MKKTDKQVAELLPQDSCQESVLQAITFRPTSLHGQDR
jgi:hypothetical protein